MRPKFLYAGLISGLIVVVVVLLQGCVKSTEDCVSLRAEGEKLLETASLSHQDKKRAIEKFKQAMSCFERAKSNQGILEVAEVLGSLSKEVRSYSEAVDLYTKAVAASIRLNQPLEQSHMLLRLGDSYLAWGRHPEAAESYEEALKVLPANLRCGDLTAELHDKLGRAHEKMGRHDKAAEYYSLNLSKYQRLKLREGEGETLLSLCKCYHRAQDKENAVKFCERAFEVAREVDDQGGLGEAALFLGTCYKGLKQHQKAEASLLQAVQINVELEKPAAEGEALFQLGLCQADIAGQMSRKREAAARDKWSEGIATLNRGFERLERAGRFERAGDVAMHLGRFLKFMGRQAEATLSYKKALASYESAGSVRGINSGTRELGLICALQGDVAEGAAYYEKALSVAKKLGDSKTETATLRDLGRLYIKWDQGKALDCFKRAWQLSKERNDKDLEERALSDMARIHALMGHPEKALEHAIAASRLCAERGEPHAEWNAAMQLVEFYRLVGRHDEGKELCIQWLDNLKKNDNKLAMTQTIGKLASLHKETGQVSEATRLYNERLAVGEQSSRRSEIVSAWGELGDMYASLGEYGEALRYKQLVLDAFRKEPESLPSGEAIMLIDIALIAARSGSKNRALEFLQEALGLHEKLGMVLTPWSYEQIGDLLLDLGEPQRAEEFLNRSGWEIPILLHARLSLVKGENEEAEKYYRRVLNLPQKRRDRRVLFAAHTGLGIALESMGNNLEASEHYRQGIVFSEHIRFALDPLHRGKFFDAVEHGFRITTPYEGLARILMKLDRPVEAFEISEFTKARAFAEGLSRRSGNSVTDLPKEILEKEFQVNHHLAELRKNTSDEAVLKEAEKQLVAHIDVLRSQHPFFAATRYPQPIRLDQSALKDDEWLVTYHVTDSDTLIYVLHGKKLVKSLSRPITRNDLRDLIKRFRDLLMVESEAEAERKLTAFEPSLNRGLAELLLGEVLSVLPEKVPVTVIPDDCIGLIPFEILILNDGGKVVRDKTKPFPHVIVKDAMFFGDRNPICYSQSLTAITLSRIFKGKNQTGHQGNRVLVLADPVFSCSDTRASTVCDIRMAASAPSNHQGFYLAAMNSMKLSDQRLAFTSDFAANLDTMFPGLCDVFTGLGATRNRVVAELAPGLAKYRYLVFATHGSLDGQPPGIVEPTLLLTMVPKGVNGLLRMTDIMSLRLEAEMVALVACQSGVGSYVSGEGIMGMGRAFQHAGANSVLMSLWNVWGPTSCRMTESALRHMKEGKKKLEALQMARQEIRKAGYDHPFFWAPFILVGEAN